MSKHRHQSRAEQMDNRVRGAETFHRERELKDDDVSSKRRPVTSRVDVADEDSVQLRAYQIYEEKGGNALDNWLEAERALNTIDQVVARLIDEVGPNSQEKNGLLNHSGSQSVS